jgi:hypothetical protein
MATLLEALPRLVFRRAPAASTDVVATISRPIRRVSTALSGTPHTVTSRAFTKSGGRRTSALSILHER